MRAIVNIYGDQYMLDDNNQWHNDVGPAVILKQTGSMFWFNHGCRHRTDGPARIYFQPTHKVEWFLDDQHYDKLEDWLDDLIGKGYKTKSEALMIYLKWKEHDR